jgi:hypothetical protein
MYKILHIPSGLVLDIPSDVNKEEADKTIRQLVRLHKQYMVSSRHKQRHMGYVKLLSKFDHLYECELEAFFVSETKKRFQIMHTFTCAYYEEFYNSKEQAELALNNALKKQQLFHNKLRAWCIPVLGLQKDNNMIAFDDPKKNYNNHKGKFIIVEV